MIWRQNKYYKPVPFVTNQLTLELAAMPRHQMRNKWVTTPFQSLNEIKGRRGRTLFRGLNVPKFGGEWCMRGANLVDYHLWPKWGSTDPRKGSKWVLRRGRQGANIYISDVSTVYHVTRPRRQCIFLSTKYLVKIIFSITIYSNRNRFLACKWTFKLD